VRIHYNGGVGGIRTHDLQRPRLTSCQARRRPLAFLGCNNPLYTVKILTSRTPRKGILKNGAKIAKTTMR
jgi:hypothetical protein